MVTFSAGFKLPTAEAIEDLHRLADGDESIDDDEVRQIARIAAHTAENVETLISLFRDYLEATGRDPHLKTS